MKTFHFPTFNKTGSAQIPSGPWVGVAIGTGSQQDYISVEHRVLAPGMIVPITGGGQPISALRGYRTYNSASVELAEQLSGPELASGGNLGGDLELVLYEACDTLVASPRAPTRVSGYLSGGSLPTTAATSALLLRLPFAGRRRATFYFKRTSNQVVNGLVQAVRYIDPVLRAKAIVLNDATLGHFTRELALGTWDPVTFIETRDSGGGGYQAMRIDIGSDDDLAGDSSPWDEIDLFVYGPAAGSAVYASAEAWGERSLA